MIGILAGLLVLEAVAWVLGALAELRSPRNLYTVFYVAGSLAVAVAGGLVVSNLLSAQEFAFVPVLVYVGLHLGWATERSVVSICRRRRARDES